MNRVHVCHYYQAGCCRNGDACQFTHPTVRCRSFTSTGWCPYGYNCNFWHDQSKKPPTPNLHRKPCQFFANNQCKYGDRCTFSHDIENDNKKQMTLAEYRATQKLAQITLGSRGSSADRSSFPKASSERTNTDQQTIKTSRASSQHSTKSGAQNTPAKGDAFSRNARPAFLRPRNCLTGAPLDGITRTEICRLQHLEVERFIKSQPAEKLREVQSCDDGRTFFLKYSPSDPDWAYDVREVVLNIHMNKMYPVEPLKITVLSKENLPDILVEHLNMSMLSWIRYKHHQFSKTNRIELYLRPFLQWLDRNLENLFTQGLRKFKAQLEGKEPDQTVHLFGETNTQDNLHHSLIDLTKSTASRRSSSTPGASPRETANSSANDESADDFDGDENSVNAASSTGESSSELNVQHDQDSDDDNSDRDVHDDSDVHDDHIGEWVEAVSAGPYNTQNDTSNPSEGDKEETVKESVTVDQQSTKPQNTLPTGSANPVSGGLTQSLLLTDLHLCGKAGTFTPRRLLVLLHCTRCRLPFNWYFNFHGQSRTNTTLNEARLRSLPPHTVSCARCKQSMEFLFQGVVAHAFENRMGTFHLTGCVADDITLKQSEIALVCTGCNNSVKFTHLEPGRQLMRHCFECHALIGLEFSKFQLEIPKGVTASALGKADSKNAGENFSTELSRKLRRAWNSSKNPLIQDGSPLPDYGTCKHYKKSYRWLRFPCCGRLEPCDVCHDSNVTDGHEMELANRMICGFCSKEQPFSATKPCVRCGKNLCGSRSAHWEGGKGCRNKVTMSRKDVKKYSQLNKTIPKGKGKA